MKSLTTQDLAAIRRIQLQVLDEGDPKRTTHTDFDFYSPDEAEANEQRLRFVDRVQELLTKEAKNDLVSEATDIQRGS
jgi:hypothetical protein